MTTKISAPPSRPSPARFYRVVFRLSRRIVLDGFEARAFIIDRDEETQITSKLTAALNLIQQYAPARLAALRRDLPRILIVPIHDLAQCLYGARMSLLRLEYVTDPRTTPTQLAMTLVHEGTHARLRRAGFPYSERYRRRVERLCVLSELILAQRIGTAESDVRDAEKRLDLSDEYWSDQALEQRALRSLWHDGFMGKLGYFIAWPVVYIRALRRRRAA